MHGAESDTAFTKVGNNGTRKIITDKRRRTKSLGWCAFVLVAAKLRLTHPSHGAEGG